MRLPVIILKEAMDKQADSLNRFIGAVIQRHKALLKIPKGDKRGYDLADKTGKQLWRMKAPVFKRIGGRVNASLKEGTLLPLLGEPPNDI